MSKIQLSKEILNFVNNTSLEDLICLKLELSFAPLKGRFFGFPVWNNLKYIVQDSVLKFVEAKTSSTEERLSFLGISKKKYKDLITQKENLL